MQHAHNLFAELETTLTHGSGPQRFTILQKLTDLFLEGVDAYTDDHVRIFDDLMSRLIEQIERKALIELSDRLAPVDRAPVKVIGRLSQHDDIRVAGPVLQHSTVLTDRDLVEITETKSQAHLSAIAGRVRINEPVTDVLINRGDSEVARKVTANEGARFSRFSLAKAVKRAEKDESLAVAIANRIDLPADLLDQLVRKATATVQQRLMANARPQMRQRISQVMANVSSQVARSVAPAGGGSGRTLMKKNPAQLRARVSRSVESRNVDELVDALAVLSELPVKAVKNLVKQGSDEGLVALGKACGMGWPELQKVLAVVAPAKAASKEDASVLFDKFAALSTADAQRAVRFIRTSSIARVRVCTEN
jgi:uncharacterized protein (DUF2336 family)